MRPQKRELGVLVLTLILGIGAALTPLGYQTAYNVCALALGIIAFGIAMEQPQRELATQTR
jgi:hypothetical protein